MSIPKVTIGFSNGNLLQAINEQGVPAIIGTGMQVANQGKVMAVNNLNEAVLAGLTKEDEPFIYRHIQEFYQELAGNKLLFIYLFDAAVEMADMLDSTNANGANKLMDATGGQIGYLGVFRKPQPNYAPGGDYMDADVSAAVLAAKSFVQAQNAKLRFLRVLIEGRVTNEASTVVYAPNTADNGFAGVVAGGTQSDGSASVGLVLGRKVKYPSHIKLGKVANGPLSVPKIYIGSREINNLNQLSIPAVAEVKATATITITAPGNDGDYIYAYANTPMGWVFLGDYTKQIGDATAPAVATAFAQSINDRTAQSGYTAAVVGAVITITAPAGMGDTLNGKQLQAWAFGAMTFTSGAFAGGVTAKAGQDFSSIEGLHDRGYISFLTYPNKAGIYIGIDNMASTDDYRILAHGAVVDEVARIAADVYINQLEGEVDVDVNGNISEIDLKHLKGLLENQVNTLMAAKISAFQAIIDPNQNIINTNKLNVKARVMPKGYTTFIDVDLGFEASQSQS